MWFQKISISTPRGIIQRWGLGWRRGGDHTINLCGRAMDIFLNSTTPEISLHILNCPTPIRNDNMMFYNKVPHSASDWLIALLYWIAKEKPDVSDFCRATCREAVMRVSLQLGCEQSLFSLKIRREEHKTSKHASVTCEQRCHQLLVVRASEDEQNERPQWFHTTFWMLH